MKLHVATALTVSFVLLLACGQKEQSTSQISSTPPAKAPVVVAIGGWNSCGLEEGSEHVSPIGMNMYPRFLELYQRLSKTYQQTSHYVLGCHDMMGYLHFYKSTTPKQLNRKASFAQILAAIEEVQKASDAPLLLIGHSHGGWMAMQAVMHLPRDLPIAKLTTIDPISKELCTPATFFSIFEEMRSRSMNKVTRPLLANSDCLKAPRDVDINQRHFIAQRSTYWQNHFQVEGHYLHSSAISNAHENHLHRINDQSWFAYRAHILVAQIPDVWQKLTQSFFQPGGILITEIP